MSNIFAKLFHGAGFHGRRWKPPVPPPAPALLSAASLVSFSSAATWSARACKGVRPAKHSTRPGQDYCTEDTTISRVSASITNKGALLLALPPSIWTFQPMIHDATCTEEDNGVYGVGSDTAPTKSVQQGASHVSVYRLRAEQVGKPSWGVLVHPQLGLFDLRGSPCDTVVTLRYRHTG